METEPGKKRPMKPKVVLAVLAAVATLVALPVVASGATLGGIISSGMVVYADSYNLPALSVDGYVFTSQEEATTVEDDVYGTLTDYPYTSTVYDPQGNVVLTTTASDYVGVTINEGVTILSSKFTENSSMLLTRNAADSDCWGLCTVTGTTVMSAIYDDLDVDSSGLYAVGRYTLDSGDYAFDVYDLSTCSKLQTITDSTWPYDVCAYFTEVDGAIYLHVEYCDDDYDDYVSVYYVFSDGTFVETSYAGDTTDSYDDDDDVYNGGTYTAADGTEFTLTETSSGALTLTVNGSTYTLASGSGSDRYDSYYLIGDWIDVWTYSGDEIIYSYLGTQIAESSSYQLADYYYNTSLIINILGSPGNYLLSTMTSVSSDDDDDEEEDETYSYTCALYAADGTKIKDIDAAGEMYLSSTYSDTPWGTVYLVCCHDYDAGTYTYLGYDEEMNPVTVGDYQLAGVTFGLKRQNSYVYYVMDTSTSLYGAVNASGEVVIPVEYTLMHDPRYTSSSYLLVQKSDGLWYLYDASAVDSANETISSSTDSDSTDSDSTDSGSTDADSGSEDGTADSGSSDVDSGSEDGTADSGSSDSGSSDVDSGSEDGSSDSGSTDSGTSDSDTTDSGTTDSGSIDSGSTEDGTADSGSSDADKVTKKANTMKVKVSTKTVKAKKLKKKAQRVKAITAKKAKGKVTYKKVSGIKKLTVNKKTGKITLKKGLKKGTYKIKVKVKAAGTSKYKAKTKTVTVKIRVK